MSARRYLYLWADGVFLQARMEDHSECMLVLIGATPEGKKELIGFQVSVRESAQSWRELLVELKAHVKAKAGAWKYPRSVEIRNELPKMRRDNQDGNSATIRMRMRRCRGDEGRA